MFPISVFYIQNYKRGIIIIIISKNYNYILLFHQATVPVPGKRPLAYILQNVEGIKLCTARRGQDRISISAQGNVGKYRVKLITSRASAEHNNHKKCTE